MEISGSGPKIPEKILLSINKIGKSFTLLQELIEKCGKAADAFFSSGYQHFIKIGEKFIKGFVQSLKDYPALYISIPIIILVLAAIGIVIGTIIYIRKNNDSKKEIEP